MVLSDPATDAYCYSVDSFPPFTSTMAFRSISNERRALEKLINNRTVSGWMKQKEVWKWQLSGNYHKLVVLRLDSPTAALVFDFNYGLFLCWSALMAVVSINGDNMLGDDVEMVCCLSVQAKTRELLPRSHNLPLGYMPASNYGFAAADYGRERCRINFFSTIRRFRRGKHFFTFRRRQRATNFFFISSQVGNRCFFVSRKLFHQRLIFSDWRKSSLLLK